MIKRKEGLVFLIFACWCPFNYVHREHGSALFDFKVPKAPISKVIIGVVATVATLNLQLHKPKEPGCSGALRAFSPYKYRLLTTVEQ